MKLIYDLDFQNSKTIVLNQKLLAMIIHIFLENILSHYFYYYEESVDIVYFIILDHNYSWRATYSDKIIDIIEIM